MDLGALALGPGGDRRILVIEPALDLLRQLFVCPLERLLRREAPALQIVADRAHRHPKAIPLLNEHTDRRARPQGKRHPQLIRGLVRHQPLDGTLLRGRQRALRPDTPPATL